MKAWIVEVKTQSIGSISHLNSSEESRSWVWEGQQMTQMVRVRCSSSLEIRMCSMSRGCCRRRSMDDQGHSRSSKRLIRVAGRRARLTQVGKEVTL